MDAKDFKDAIQKWRSSPPAASTVRGDKGSFGNVTVVVRKRPLFKHEEDKGEFDVVSCMGAAGDAGNGAVVHQCHEKLVVGRGMVKHLNNVTYPCQEVFSEESSSEEVYHTCAAPLVKVAAAHGTATCFVYGQTGSGKTHTMTAIQGLAATDVFELADGQAIHLAYFELVGKRCFDLLDQGHKEVFLQEGKDNKMHVAGAAELTVDDADQLRGAMKAALGRRETASTGANASSSRSHAVCRIRIGDGKRRGMLTLVDLAGSERKHDSMYHDADRRRECAEFNSSLMALKECIRYRALQAIDPSKSVHVPYRGSSLTRVLKDSLDSEDAHTTVIATASPCATDTEHTMGTFDTVSRLTGAEKDIVEYSEEVHTWTPPPVEMKPPQKWDASELQEWLGKLPSKYKEAVTKVPSSMTGKQFMQLSVERLSAMMDLRSVDVALAHQLYNRYRAEVKKVQDEVDARRKQVVEDMHKKKHIKSSLAPSFAPSMPT